MGARGPKALGPTLASLTPADVGQEAVDRLLRRAGRLALELQPAATIHLPDAVSWDGTQIGLTMGDLTEYAQRGGDHDEAHEALISVLPALYASASDTGSYSVPDLDVLAHDADAVAMVLSAALARVALSRGEPVTAASLATLAGLSVDAVRSLARGGELTPDGGRPARYEAAEALRWLSGRGWT